jgi:hypothetical protein
VFNETRENAVKHVLGARVPELKDIAVYLLTIVRSSNATLFGQMDLMIKFITDLSDQMLGDEKVL